MRVDCGHRAAKDVEPAGIGWWLDQHAAVMLFACAAGAAFDSALPMVLGAGASFTIFWHRHRPRLARALTFCGYANALTALRLLLILAAAAAMTRIPAWAVFVAFAANVALDVADGRVARRTAESSTFGAVLDRETDGLFVLTAYQYFFLTRGVGAWVLVPGLMPYLYRVVARALATAPLSEERQPLAALLAGVNFAILLAAVVAPPPLALPLLAVSAALVASSFGAAYWKLYPR